MNKVYRCRTCQRKFVLQILNSQQQEIVIADDLSNRNYCDCTSIIKSLEMLWDIETAPGMYERFLDKHKQFVNMDSRLGRILWTNSKNSTY